MNKYNFGKVQCASGEWKPFECSAENARQARALLVEFIKNN